jgi:hypothetical protein
MLVSRRVRLLASTLLLAALSSQAHAQKQILSAVEGEDLDDEDVIVVSTTGSQTASYANAIGATKALTDIGINKVRVTSSTGNEFSGSSAWLDTFTAAGPAGSKVRMSLSFTIDGSANFARNPGSLDGPEYDFKVFAMRGSGWTMQGHDDEAMEGPYLPRFAGDGYDELFLQRVDATGIQQLAMQHSNYAMVNFANNNGDPGAFRTQVAYLENMDAYRIVSLNPQGIPTASYFYDSFFRSGTPNGPVGNPIFYNAGTPLANQLAGTRNSLEANFAILDTASLCEDQIATCTANKVYEPTTLNLDFEVVAGQSFTIAAWLYADEVANGTFDFFNTAKLTGLYAETETGEAVTVTSASGTLVARPGGGFGYANVSVPEPATWAMMILGFGVVGGAARRRARTIVAFA